MKGQPTHENPGRPRRQAQQRAEKSEPRQSISARRATGALLSALNTIAAIVIATAIVFGVVFEDLTKPIRKGKLK